MVRNWLLFKCKVVANGTLPLFICEAEGHTIETQNAGTTVRIILEFVESAGKRNGSGQESFGFYRKEVFRVLGRPELLQKDRFVIKHCKIKLIPDTEIQDQVVILVNN